MRRIYHANPDSCQVLAAIRTPQQENSYAQGKLTNPHARVQASWKVNVNSGVSSVPT